MMQWSHPEMQGNLPPLCCIYSMTLVGCNIVIISGGEGASYYNSMHVSSGTQVNQRDLRWASINIEAMSE